MWETLGDLKGSQRMFYEHKIGGCREEECQNRNSSFTQLIAAWFVCFSRKILVVYEDALVVTLAFRRI